MLGIFFNCIPLYIVVNYITPVEGSVKCSFFLNTFLSWLDIFMCLFMWVDVYVSLHITIEKISALSIQPCICGLNFWGLWATVLATILHSMNPTWVASIWENTIMLCEMHLMFWFYECEGNLKSLYIKVMSLYELIFL